VSHLCSSVSSLFDLCSSYFCFFRHSLDELSRDRNRADLILERKLKRNSGKHLMSRKSPYHLFHVLSMLLRFNWEGKRTDCHTEIEML
jgi:hypothetical protein